jgi:hypothetical protein
MENQIDLTDPIVRKDCIGKFQDIDNIIHKLFTKIKKLGRVVIITNAMPEWVNLSASILRKTESIIRDIDIISARQLHHESAEMKHWKSLCFHDVMKKHNQKRQIVNIISIGDADYEYYALINLYQHQDGHHDRYLKSIQFIRRPPYSTLKDQLKQTSKHIKTVCHHEDHLDLDFKNHEDIPQHKRLPTNSSKKCRSKTKRRTR